MVRRNAAALQVLAATAAAAIACGASPAFAAKRPPAAPAKSAAPAPAADAKPAPEQAKPTETATPWGKLSYGTAKQWPLTKTVIEIGSDPSADIVINDATVAPHHVRLTFAKGNATIEDLGSKSGTLMNGTALKPGKPLNIVNATEIDPGAVTLQFQFLDRGTVGAIPADQVHGTQKIKPTVPRPH